MNKLRRLYWDEGISISKIAKMIGCSRNTVSRALNHHSIKKRTKREVIQNTAKRSFDHIKYNILDDANKLRRLYWDEELYIKDIAKLANCSNGAVINAFKRCNIKRRTHKMVVFKYAKRIEINSHLHEYITGSLLGDGHVQCRGLFTSRFSIGSKYEEYIKHIQNIFQNSNYQASYYLTICRKNGKEYKIFMLKSSSSIQLKQYRDLWYVDNIKHVPDDLKLTPVVCLYWYLEDGHCAWYRRKIDGKLRFAGVQLFTGS
jgi:predicted DNA-binding protein YlxM (UPF0122 family)